MDGKEFYKYAKLCHDNQITIYPKASNTGKYKIIINTRGKEKTGDEIYEDKAYTKEINLQTPNGMRRVKVEVPSIADKIFQLYKQICIKNKLLESIIN